jgi:hypothetical protein
MFLFDTVCRAQEAQPPRLRYWTPSCLQTLAEANLDPGSDPDPDPDHGFHDKVSLRRDSQDD